MNKSSASMPTPTLKLSQLADDIQITSDSNTTRVWEVEELKWAIYDGFDPIGEWYTVKSKKWKPSARFMIESYIENEYDSMYEDWDERAMDCISDTLIENIQTLLDEAFKCDLVSIYYEYDKPVEIDVYFSEGCDDSHEDS